MNHLTNKQLAARNEGFNPNRAGDALLKFCNVARAELNARLTRPAISDEAAYEAFIISKISIKNMDHQELRAALRA